MKLYDTFQAFYDEQSAPHHPGTEQGADAEPRDTPNEGVTDRSPRHTSQSERAAMHPDHHDLEWRYWRSGWVA